MSTTPASDTGALTGLSPAELASWLAQMREATALSGEAALERADELLWAYGEWRAHRSDLSGLPESDTRSDDEYRRDLVQEDLTRLGETMDRLRRALAVPGSLQSWDGATLLRQADSLGYLAGPEARAAAADAITQAKVDALPLAREVDIGVHRHALTLAATRAIHNAGSIQTILGAVDVALAELRRLDALTPEDEQQGRDAKQRAASFRSQRKLEEAEVCASGGRLKMAERLRAEAATLLKIDMAKAGLES